MIKPAIIVAGMGRCGTSLMMQMLEATGIPCVGTYPAFETDRSRIGSFDCDFLAALRSTAIKIIDPMHIDLPPLDNHVVIWLDRDPREQARSMLKFMADDPRIALNRDSRRMLEKSLRKDRATNLYRLRHPSRIETSFEDMIGGVAAGTVASFLRNVGYDADTVLMQSAVVPRPTHCLPYMLEAALLLRRPA